MKRTVFTIFVLSWCLSGLIMAQNVPGLERKVDPRIAQLEMALNHISQEQQSVYQQFQMLQEMRQSEVQDINPLVMQDMGGVKDMPPITYDESVRVQRERKDRFQQHARELDRLYARYSELGEQKKAILEQLRELAKETAR
jgi:chaperonin cofactor prefoldin